MKQYLIDFFKYNDWANKQMIESIGKLPDKEEAINLFSHVIISLNRWIERATKGSDNKGSNWFDQTFPYDQLEKNWTEILNKWVQYIESVDDAKIESKIVFQRPADGKRYRLKLQDIALQINYHSIHHRAQIYRIIRQQGIAPPATDYIYTVFEEV